MTPFPHDTFVVVDLPDAVVQHVRDLRRRYGSARQFLPVEITIAGSSGVGVFDPTQDAEAALATLRHVARDARPFAVAFSGVARFPDSGVFYYALADTAPFVELHHRVVASGLRFAPSPFPFSPHLTIDTFDDAPPDLERELLALPVPAGAHAVDTLSVYSLKGWDCRRVTSYPLGPERG
jgi:2'-5' RNA ligase